MSRFAVTVGNFLIRWIAYTGLLVGGAWLAGIALWRWGR